jgi:hypothetical protein
MRRLREVCCCMRLGGGGVGLKATAKTTAGPSTRASHFAQDDNSLLGLALNYQSLPGAGLDDDSLPGAKLGLKRLR